MLKVDWKQLPRIPVVLVFSYLGAMVSYVFMVLAHEMGHYLAASLFNPGAISGFYFPMENAYKMFFYQKLTEITACPGTAACVTYKASVLDSFGLFGGLIVAMAGVATTAVILFFLLKAKCSIEKDKKNQEGLVRTAEAAFLLGTFMVAMAVSVEWIGDGTLAFMPLLHNVYLTAFVISVILIPLCVVALSAGLDLIVYIAPGYAPYYSKLKGWLFATYKLGG